MAKPVLGAEKDESKEERAECVARADALATRLPAFESVRADSALAALPEPEAAAWRGFWHRVRGILAPEGG